MLQRECLDCVTQALGQRRTQADKALAMLAAHVEGLSKDDTLHELAILQDLVAMMIYSIAPDGDSSSAMKRETRVACLRLGLYR